VGEGLTDQSEHGGQQGDEAQHGHAAIQLFGPLMEAPAALGGNDIHAGLRGEGIEAATVFCRHRGAADGGALKGVGGGSGGLGDGTEYGIVERIATDCFGMWMGVNSKACGGYRPPRQAPG